MKNIVFVHLESLNMLNYRMNPHLFPNLRKIEQRCISYSNYYSTATSTLMVIGDLMYGGMEQYEGCKSLGDIPQEYFYQSSIFDDLKDAGYHTGIYIYPEGGDRDTAEERHIAGFHNRMVLKKNYEEYLGALEDTMLEQPFALMACNYISNLTLNQYLDIDQYGEQMSYWEAGYREMDRCVGDIWTLLEKHELLDNTVVIFYGDHGDDFWGHGMHIGLTHAIEPNPLLIHTPLFIYDGSVRKETRFNFAIVQPTDFRSMVEQVLKTGEWQDPAHPYAFARNEYAAQPVRKDSFNKAYSLTDGKYLLMVSANGLEMYETEMDPACQNNLLRFFKYQKEALVYDYVQCEAYGFHFRNFMSPRQQRLIRRKFYEMREILKQRVLAVYSLTGDAEKACMEMDFDSIVKG
jgi:membrane-anchored protein YejM (alkaline phosphatase superfamily)